MNSWFTFSADDRKDLISDTAAQLQMAEAIIEKDIWLITILGVIFNSPLYSKHFIFKGGTSLSKVYNVIHRFSEDIDLIMNWELIGYSQGSTDPWAERSRTQQDKLNKEMHDRADAYLANTFAPWLQDQLAELQNATVVPTGNGKVEIRYPAIFSTPYIADTVLLEIGPLASWIPSAQHQIRSYIAEKHQQILLETPTVLTVTTSLLRPCYAE